MGREPFGFGTSLRLFAPSEIPEELYSSKNPAVSYVREIASLKGSAVANVATEIYLLESDSEYFPVTVDHGRIKNNSYVVSPSSTYVGYADFELREIPLRFVRVFASVLIRLIGAVLKTSNLDAIVQVNNWLLSTNLYPPTWQGAELPEITRQLTQQFPGHAIGLRSLNKQSNAGLIRTLEKLGYQLILSRQVYFFGLSGCSVNFLSRHNVQIDRRTLKKSAYGIISGSKLERSDFERLEHLYNLLYLEKYSRLNPQFTANWLYAGHRDGWLSLKVLRSKEGRIDGVVGFFSNDQVLTAPIVGYDTALPMKTGLYRMLTAICLEETSSRGSILNFSSGAAHFKRLRGGAAEIEYSAVYTKHLSVWPKICWRALGIIANNVGIPLLKWFKL